MSEPEERRRAERIVMPATGGPVSVVGGRLIDVSPYGMAIESMVALTVDSVTDFQISVASEKHTVGARVASCRPCGDGRRGYAVGLEFVTIEPELRERIRQTLATLRRAAGAT